MAERPIQVGDYVTPIRAFSSTGEGDILCVVSRDTTSLYTELVLCVHEPKDMLYPESHVTEPGAPVSFALGNAELATWHPVPKFATVEEAEQWLESR